MKISLALLVLLLAAAWAGTQGESLRSSKVTCCPKDRFLNQKIPKCMIKEYKDTAPSCTHKAVLVKLRSGGVVCVDPKNQWFQDYLKNQKQSNSTCT